MFNRGITLVKVETNMKIIFTVLLMAMSFPIIALPVKNERPKEMKELSLQIVNDQTEYPIDLHYTISSEKTIYAQGFINGLNFDKKQYIYVNQIPSLQSIKFQVDKITVGNRTVFNDPCIVHMTEKQLQASILVGFKGNPETHGSFTCNFK